MNNSKLGFYAAITAALSTFIFAISMIISIAPLSYGICMLLAWSYILVACAFAAEAGEERKALAYGGVAFACIYAVFTNLVYFTQLTTVAQTAAAPEILRILTFDSGSWIFNFDIFGYAMMAVSTFLVGLTIVVRKKSDKWLKILLMIHGVFAPTGVMFPMLNLFTSNENVQQGNNAGVIALEIWCVLFTPIMLLAAVYFKSRRQIIKS